MLSPARALAAVFLAASVAAIPLPAARHEAGMTMSTPMVWSDCGNLMCICALLEEAVAHRARCGLTCAHGKSGGGATTLTVDNVILKPDPVSLRVRNRSQMLTCAAHA